jgi:virginiamycin B lyase
MLRHPTIGLALALALCVAGAAAARAALVEVLELPEGAQPCSVAPQTFGKVWYTSQGQGALGIIDPATGEIEHIAIGENSIPKTVLEGPDGAAWIVDSGLNAIVRIDVTLEEVRSWPLPEGRGNAGLSDAVFDEDGRIWFTGEAGIYGWFDHQTGDMKVFDAPGGPGPYGITMTPDGDIYYASFESNHIVRIDRATGEATVITPPTPEQGARDVSSDTKGRIWVSEESSGQLSRYDPGSGEWKAWTVPGEAPRPYAILVDDRDVVWLSDLGSSEIHVFDTSREHFVAKYPSSHEGAEVRQIIGGLNEVWLPESALDRLMLIRPGSTGLY